MAEEKKKETAKKPTTEKKATTAKKPAAKKAAAPKADAVAKKPAAKKPAAKKAAAPKAEKKVEAPKEETPKAEAAPKAEKKVEAEAPKEETPKAEAAPKKEAPKAAEKKPVAKPESSGDEGTLGSTDIRMADLYKDRVIDILMKEFNYSTLMQVPKINKITVNIGVGEAVTNNKAIDNAVRDLTAITGQKPLVTRAKKSIATFKLREGMPIGCMTTMRGTRMYEFLDRLVNFSMPRIKDFRGISDKSFDGRGNYTFGLKEQIIYPEIEYDKIDKIRGMNITITTSANTDEEGKALLRQMGMPFRN